MRHISVFLLCVLLAACATTRDGGGKPPKARESGQKPVAENGKAPVATKDPRPLVTIMQDIGTLGDTVVHFGETVGGGFVVMKGIENRPVPPMNYQKTDFKKVIMEIAGATQCHVAECPYYFFLYPPGYESLLGLSLSGRLDSAVAAKTAAMTFGSDTPLYKALTLLSASMGAAIVADNVLSEARTGAVTLAELPVGDALEALLKSARLSPDAFQVESTPEYVFLYVGPPVPPRSTLIGEETLTPEDRAYLDTVVDLYLPERPADTKQYVIPAGAATLGRVLDSLSEQLNRTVIAAPGMEDFPVNPCALVNVRIRTALDLLIRQWPLPDFGYAIEGGQIVIRRNKG